MTETAPQHLRLPVDASPPPERLRWPMLLAAAAVALVLHLALVTVFTPLAPEKNESTGRTDHSMLFISSRAEAVEPAFLKMVDIYDPVAFLHPPEDIGFSFFRTAGVDFSLDAPSEPVLPTQSLPELNPFPPARLEPVVRPLAWAVADDDDPDAEIAPVSGPSYPYCVADSRPDAVFPAFPLDARTERILQRSPPVRPSVFELRRTTDVIPDLPDSDSGPGGYPACEAILTESCGVAELDLAARAWLDTTANSQAGAAFRRGDRCRIVWSAASRGKEPSAR